MDNNEIWVNMYGFEDFYLISNLGKVKRKSRTVTNNKYGGKMTMKEKVLSPYLSAKGYPTLRIQQDNERYSIPVHRYVMLSFSSMPEDKTQVNHIDGNKENNRLDNLEWVDNSENQKHAYKLGLQKDKRGESNSRAILKEKDVIEILKDDVTSLSELARKYNISKSAISLIKRRKTWKHISIGQ